MVTEILIIGVLSIVAVWTVLLDIKARKGNREWLTIKTKARVQLAKYLKGNHSKCRKEHAEWCVTRYCEVCDKIAVGGLFDSKKNVLFAEHSTLLLEELKRIGFFEEQDPDPQGDV